MDIVRLVLLFIHLLGIAVLLGGLIVQAKEPTKRITSWVRDGAGTAFVAGLLLVGVLEGLDADVNHTKVAVKLGLGLVILVIALINMRKASISTGLWATLLVLTVVNVAVAVFWSSPHKVADDDNVEAAPIVLVQR
ncbi:hypothetical protein [Nocardioides sp. zg-DK7169]|uniref:hypothetical protein n=1 Tax=Nocardioides sp. zg-DK7169 TaxID=2736600 RepID=UPI001555D847|nr:hypothetical protein [Nocardioides sp. zg-DK7169]NPC96447.1 hypothetical protein [Nocardioides sp. zg-DK7169]